MSDRKQLDKAIVSLTLKSPFYATLMKRLLSFVEEPSVPIMATDGFHIYYNPSSIATFPVPVIEGIIVHEILHTVLNHPLRMRNFDQIKWNIATDYAVNIIVADDGFTLPSGCLYNDAWRGMAAEEIIKKLPDVPTSAWNFGTIISPKSLPDGRPITSDNLTEVEAKIKAAVMTAATAARMAGKLPAGIERLIGDLISPKIPWRTLLANYVSQVFMKYKETWTMPHRRYIPYNLYLPCQTTADIGQIVVCLDTSGSIDQKALNSFASELTGILASAGYNNPIIVLTCDADVQTVTEVASPMEITSLPLKGGGGTSYVPPFKFMRNKSIEPAIFIYFTDGECDVFPKYTPDFPVIWVLSSMPTYYRHTWRTVPFGDIVVIEN